MFSFAMTNGLANDSDKFKLIITLRRVHKFVNTEPYKKFDFLFNPQMPKVFRQPKTSKGEGLMQPPWIFAFPSEFVENIFLVGMFSGSRNPTVMTKKFYLYCMTLKIKVKHLFA